MRYLGPYGEGVTPTVTDLVAASTPGHAAALQPYLATMIAAEKAYSAAVPDVHAMSPAGLSARAREVLKAAYKGRSDNVRTLLAAMAASLPRPHADLCPFCALDTGPDLDHYLPQAKFPELCLTARNLVPICGVCNRRKGDAVGDGAGERQFLHPLYDRPGQAPLLKADLAFTGAAHAGYRLERPASVPDTDFRLAERHFKRLDLATRYTGRANSHLASLGNNMRRHSAAVIRRIINGGHEHALLSEPENGWRRALYEAIASEMPATVEWIMAQGRPLRGGSLGTRLSGP